MSLIADEKLPPRAWLTVALVFFVCTFNYLDRVTITTMHASIVGAIPMNEKQFGLLTSAFYAVYGILSPFAGYLSDRFSRKWVLVMSLFWWSAVTLLTAYARTFGMLLLTRILMGASEACAIPAGLALIADYHTGPTRSLATGIHMCGVQLGTALSGIGGWLAETHSWNFAFRIFGAAGLSYGVLLCLLLRDAPARAGGAAVAPSDDGVRFGQALASLLGNGMFLLAVLYWGLLGVTGGALTGWLPTYMAEHFHLSQSRAGFLSTSCLQPVSMLGLLAGGVLADRWSRRTPRARMLGPALGLCLAAPGIFVAANTGVLPLAMFGLVVFYLTKASTDANMMPILCLVTDPRYRATGYGVLNFCSCLVISVTVFVGGAVRDAHIGVNVVYSVGACILLLCAGLLALIRPVNFPRRPGD